MTAGPAAGRAAVNGGWPPRRPMVGGGAGGAGVSGGAGVGGVSGVSGVSGVGGPGSVATR